MNGNLLALGTVSALALGTAVRRGSRSVQSRTVQFTDLVSNFQVLLEDLMEERWGSDDGEPVSPPDVLPVTLRAVEPLYRQVEHDSWDDRGPAHVAEMVRTMGCRIPAALRRDPDAVADRLLARVACLKFRGTGKPRKRISCPWMAPVVTFGGVVADGRHRLFAAHQLGITHLPSIEMDDLGPAGSRSRTPGAILGDLPLYHGTRHDFEVFQLGHAGRKDNGWLGRGVYLTDSPDLAESYAKIKRGPVSPRVMEVRAFLQNPYVVDDQEDPDLKKKIAEKGERATLAMTAELRRLGHDGVILHLPEGGGAREIVVLDPGRIQHVRTRVLPPRRKKIGSLARAILFHVSPASNRASIERHGLRAPAYLVADASGASAIAGAHREDGETVDTWRVDASGLDVDRDPEQPGHWLVCREPVPASRVTRVSETVDSREKSAAFHAWFGQSHVVDNAGKPLVVYHGTSAVFDTFDKKMRGSVSESSDSKTGFFFTSSLQRAEEAARDAAWMTKPKTWARPAPDAARVMRVYLKMERPLVRHDIQDDPADTAKVIRAAKRAGHDGVVWMNGERGGRDYVVFEPSQVKSATENSGAFEPGKASIHLNRAGSPARRTARPIDLSWLPDVVYHGTCDTFWNEDSAQAITKPVSLCVSDRLKQAREYAVETAWHVRDGDLPGVKDASSWPLIVRMTRADLVAMAERGAEIIGDYGVEDFDFDSTSRTRKNAGAKRSYEELGTFCIYGAAVIESFKDALDVEEIDLPGAEEDEDEDGEFGEDA